MDDSYAESGWIPGVAEVPLLMYVLWGKRRLKASPRGPVCRHAAANRYSLVPHLVRYARGAPGDYEIVISLPSFRSCCRKNVEIRRDWWRRVDPVLERLRQAGPDQDHGRDVDVAARAYLRNIDVIRKVLEGKIPRPRAVVTRAMTREAVRQAKADEEAVVRARMTTSACWSTLGCAP